MNIRMSEIQNRRDYSLPDLSSRLETVKSDYSPGRVEKKVTEKLTGQLVKDLDELGWYTVAREVVYEKPEDIDMSAFDRFTKINDDRVFELGEHVSDMDIMFYNPEDNHVHYCEVKKDKEKQNREKKAREQIELAYNFWSNLNFTISASELYIRERKHRYHPVLESDDEPKISLRDAVYSFNSVDPEAASLLEREEKSEKKIELSGFPPKKICENFHPHYIDRQLETRFPRFSDSEEVQIAIYSNRKPSELNGEIMETDAEVLIREYDDEEHVVLLMRPKVADILE